MENVVEAFITATRESPRLRRRALHVEQVGEGMPLREFSHGWDFCFSCFVFSQTCQ